MIIPILNIVALSFSAADRVGEVGGFYHHSQRFLIDELQGVVIQFKSGNEFV